MRVIPHYLLHVGDRVRLRTDVPNAGLQCGETGSVCSTWFSPNTVFEVEFEHPDVNYPTRVLLSEDQIETGPQPQPEDETEIQPEVHPLERFNMNRGSLIPA